MSASAMQISELGLKYAQPGYIGAKGVVGNTITAEAPLFALRVLPYTNPLSGNVVNRPIAITQLRMKWVTTTAYDAAQLGMALEVHKTTCTANHDTGGAQVLAQRKSTSGYDAIPATEIDVYITGSGAISGGSHTLIAEEGAPFDVAVGAGVSPAFESIWVPEDGFPLKIEQNEGLLIHNAIELEATGAGLLFVGIDFFRF